MKYMIIYFELNNTENVGLNLNKDNFCIIWGTQENVQVEPKLN